MKNEIRSKKIKNEFLIFLLKIFVFVMEFILNVSKSGKKKEYTPTTEELISKERIIGSDKYEYPEQKFK